MHAIHTVARGDALVSPAVTRTLIGRFGGRIRPEHPSDQAISSLTAREKEVFLLMADGLSNAEIAKTLVISLETVKTYVSRIFVKLDLRDRVQAVVLAHRLGLANPA